MVFDRLVDKEFFRKANSREEGRKDEVGKAWEHAGLQTSETKPV